MCEHSYGAQKRLCLGDCPLFFCMLSSVPQKRICLCEPYDCPLFFCCITKPLYYVEFSTVPLRQSINALARRPFMTVEDLAEEPSSASSQNLASATKYGGERRRTIRRAGTKRPPTATEFEAADSCPCAAARPNFGTTNHGFVGRYSVPNDRRKASRDGPRTPECSSRRATRGRGRPSVSGSICNTQVKCSWYRSRCHQIFCTPGNLAPPRKFS